MESIDDKSISVLESHLEKPIEQQGILYAVQSGKEWKIRRVTKEDGFFRYHWHRFCASVGIGHHGKDEVQQVLGGITTKNPQDLERVRIARWALQDAPTNVDGTVLGVLTAGDHGISYIVF